MRRSGSSLTGIPLMLTPDMSSFPYCACGRCLNKDADMLMREQKLLHGRLQDTALRYSAQVGGRGRRVSRISRGHTRESSVRLRMSKFGSQNFQHAIR